MAVRRQRLTQRRKTVGFTQERLAEQLGVDPTTVRRWESGETRPQPWLRPKLARCLEVSAEQLDELLREGADDLDERELLPGSVPLRPGNELLNAEMLSLDVHSGVFFPVIANGCPVLVPLGGDTDATTGRQ